jgi:alkylation response protein AidB-like acyl-CoA dehydrogenase
MTNYRAPLRDMQFVLFDLFHVDQHYQTLPNASEVTSDLINPILEESAKFAEHVLYPLNQSGDKEGCHVDEGVVTTPKGFRQAYQQYIAGGWPSLAASTEFGGQGLPYSLSAFTGEMLCSANLAWSLYPGLSHGCINALESHGSDEYKKKYLPKLIEGVWTGTMCLTEPHCGSDLGILRTRATPADDGSYHLNGTKIFISAGEHDLSENIIHLVLARLPDAPEGTKGISMFVVPKFLVNESGALGERNAVKCGSIEHKMGIKGSATCVMNFDNAVGFLIGEPNKGLSYMFTMMNEARLMVGVQGLGVAEATFQSALVYAKERLQMRALSGAKFPEKQADPIIVHADVRRMLLTQKAFAEGGRALAYYAALLADRAQRCEGDEKTAANDLLSFLTPICKAGLTEIALESANLGVQIYGGHGYITDNGMEQFVRDCRITTIYEGTTGIQALDLLGRKVLMTQGELLKNFTKVIHKFCKAQEGNSQAKEFIEPLATINKEWGDITMRIGLSAMQNRDEVGAAATDYLMYSVYITLAYFWARMALVSQDKLVADTDDKDFYEAKIHTARFYFKRILPRTRGLSETMMAGVASLEDLPADNFTF